MRRWRDDPAAFVSQLRAAAHLDGFFLLRHRIEPPQAANNVLHAANALFNLPPHAKRAIDYSRSPAFRGYMAVGVENTDGRTDNREQFEVAEEAVAPTSRDGDNLQQPHQRLRGPNLWPAELPELRTHVETFASAMLAVSRELTRALALALGLQPAALLSVLEPQPHWQLKLAHYPVATRGSATQGCGAHCDSGFITLVLADGHESCLQAFSRGEWLDVPALGPEWVTCNLGEVAEILSSGYLLATPHRVLPPRCTPRISVPWFYNPPLECEVRPLALPSTLEWERSGGEGARHWRRPGNVMLRKYGLNAFKSLARSHPDVFRDQHPDLTLGEDGEVRSHRDRTW